MKELLFDLYFLFLTNSILPKNLFSSLQNFNKSYSTKLSPFIKEIVFNFIFY